MRQLNADDPNGFSALFNRFIRTIGDSSFPKALEVVKSFEPDASAKKAILYALHGGLKSDPVSVWGYALSNAEILNSERAHVLGSIASTAAHLAKNAAEFNSLLPESQSSEFKMGIATAGPEIIINLANKSPMVAAEWLRTTSHKVTGASYTELGQIWARASPSEASLWALSLETQPRKDYANAGIISTIQKYQPLDAVKMAVNIQASGLRVDSLKAIAPYWPLERSPGALDYLDNLKLDKEVRILFK